MLNLYYGALFVVNVLNMIFCAVFQVENDAIVALTLRKGCVSSPFLLVPTSLEYWQ